jgi:hypothetical protein
MSHIAQSALAAAAIVGAGSALLPAVPPCYRSGILPGPEFRNMRASALPRQDRLPLRLAGAPGFNERLKATRYEPEDERHLISGRYWRADAVLLDERTRDIWYLIEGRTGFASIGDNVETAHPALIAKSMTVAAVSGIETPWADEVLE